MEGGGWSSFAAPLPNAHPRLAGPLLLRPLQATIWSAWQQLQTYKSDLPTLFSKNEALVVSDGNGARVGTLTSGREWFKPWRTVTGETMADPHMTELQVMLEGVFEPRRILALIRDFIVFEDDGSGALVKKMAGYHHSNCLARFVVPAQAGTRRGARAGQPLH